MVTGLSTTVATSIQVNDCRKVISTIETCQIFCALSKQYKHRWGTVTGVSFFLIAYMPSLCVPLGYLAYCKVPLYLDARSAPGYNTWQNTLFGFACVSISVETIAKYILFFEEPSCRGLLCSAMATSLGAFVKINCCGRRESLGH